MEEHFVARRYLSACIKSDYTTIGKTDLESGELIIEKHCILLWPEEEKSLKRFKRSHSLKRRAIDKVVKTANNV